MKSRQELRADVGDDEIDDYISGYDICMCSMCFPIILESDPYTTHPRNETDHPSPNGLLGWLHMEDT